MMRLAAMLDLPETLYRLTRRIAMPVSDPVTWQVRNTGAREAGTRGTLSQCTIAGFQGGRPGRLALGHAKHPAVVPNAERDMPAQPLFEPR